MKVLILSLSLVSGVFAWGGGHGGPLSGLQRDPYLMATGVALGTAATSAFVFSKKKKMHLGLGVLAGGLYWWSSSKSKKNFLRVGLDRVQFSYNF